MYRRGTAMPWGCPPLHANFNLPTPLIDFKHANTIIINSMQLKIIMLNLDSGLPQCFEQ